MVDRVGFIGLGIMGRPMARRLQGAGVPLTVYSRSDASVEELTGAGAERAGSPAELASSADVMITMLPDTPDVEAVLFGDDGAANELRPGSLVIDMSTIDPAAAHRAAERLAAGGVGMLDAPVSGGERGAIDGTLSIMVGGPARQVDRAATVFTALGSVVHVGEEVGSGQVCKACNQLVVASTIEAVAEAIVLAERAGVDAARVRDALLGGFARSAVLEAHGARMLEGRFDPGFRARLHAKDARIVLSAASAAGLELPGFGPVAAQLARLVDAGRGELDHAALVTLLRAEGS